MCTCLHGSGAQRGTAAYCKSCEEARRWDGACNKLQVRRSCAVGSGTSRGTPRALPCCRRCAWLPAHHHCGGRRQRAARVQSRPQQRTRFMPAARAAAETGGYAVANTEHAHARLQPTHQPAVPLLLPTAHDAGAPGPWLTTAPPTCILFPIQQSIIIAAVHVQVKNCLEDAGRVVERVKYWSSARGAESGGTASLASSWSIHHNAPSGLNRLRIAINAFEIDMVADCMFLTTAQSKGAAASDTRLQLPSCPLPNPRTCVGLWLPLPRSLSSVCSPSSCCSRACSSSSLKVKAERPSILGWLSRCVLAPSYQILQPALAARSAKPGKQASGLLTPNASSIESQQVI